MGGTGQLIGTVGGGVVGAVYGGPAGATAGSSIGGAVGGGIDSMIGSEQDAAYASYLAEYNAVIAKQTGEINAQNILTIAESNAQSVLTQADADANAIDLVVDYNTDLQTLIRQYNNSLLEAEMAILWDAAELDIQQYSNEARAALGIQQAKFAASGILLGREDESLDMALVDSKTQTDLDILIKRYNADLGMARILDQMAKNTFEGQLAVEQIRFEGEVNKFNILSSAEIQSQSIVNQGTISASAALTAGNNGLVQSLWEGSWDAYNSTTEGREDFVDGLLSASATSIDAYSNDTFPSSGPTTTDINAFDSSTPIGDINTSAASGIA